MKTLPLHHLAESVSEIRRVYGATDKSLRHHRLVPENAKLDFVPLRRKSPVIEGQGSKRPDSAADALHADEFPLSSAGALIFGAPTKSPSSLLMMPAMKTKSRPPAIAPRLAPVAEVL